MLKARLLTALGLFPLAFIILFVLSEFWFSLMIGMILIIGAWEWIQLSGLECSLKSMFLLITFAGVLVLAYSISITLVPIILGIGCMFWLVAGILVLKYPTSKKYMANVVLKLSFGLLVMVPTFIGLVSLRQNESHVMLIALLVSIIWAADVGAYFIGTQFGKTKLAPNVSPGKSRIGAFGGLFLALGFGVLTTHWFSLDDRTMTRNAWFWLIPIIFVTVLFSVLGDLFESLLKREHGVKNSSSLLPGHGGVLDRIDSLTAATPVFGLWVNLTGWPVL